MTIGVQAIGASKHERIHAFKKPYKHACVYACTYPELKRHCCKHPKSKDTTVDTKVETETDTNAYTRKWTFLSPVHTRGASHRTMHFGTLLPHLNPRPAPSLTHTGCRAYCELILLRSSHVYRRKCHSTAPRFKPHQTVMPLSGLTHLQPYILCLMHSSPNKYLLPITSLNLKEYCMRYTQQLP